MPLGVWPTDDGGVRFGPALAQATQRAIALRFRHPFWETLDGGSYRSGAFFSGDGAFPTYWTQLPVRPPTLVAWAGGPAAERLAESSETDLMRVALDGAAELFGAPQTVNAAYEAGYVHDWQSDPFARGAYSYVVVDGGDARSAVARPVDDVPFFAGEVTASAAEGGTVAGALESGARAARDVLGARARC